MKTVIIFGGSGFVGRHITRRLAKNGYKIIIPHNRSTNEARLRLLGNTGQVTPIKFTSIKEEKIQYLINNSDVVLNLKTSWDEKKISYKKSILNFNIQLVNIIKEIKKPHQFIYFSGLGVDKVGDSLRSFSIFESEKYIKKNLNNSFIIRPGIIIGGGDQFLNGLLPIFKKSFFIPLFGDGSSRFQPIFIDDVSLGINHIIKNNLSGNHTYDFVGSEVFTYKDFYNFIADSMNKTRIMVPIPFGLAKLGISIIEKTPFSPLNLEQLNLFEKDNISLNNHENLSNLYIKAQDLSEIIKKIIKKNT